MRRRTFLPMAGAASLGPVALDRLERTTTASSAATVLYDDRSLALDRTGPDPQHAADVLWVRKRDLPRINGFELKPHGACRADLCIPIPKDLLRGEYFNLTAFAKQAGQSVVAEPGARVWSFGEMQALGGGFITSRIAPDFTVPDRAGARSICRTSAAGRCWWSPGPPGEAAVLICQVGRNSTPN